MYTEFFFRISAPLRGCYVPVISDASIGMKRLQHVHFQVAMSGVELLMWLLLKLGAKGSMLLLQGGLGTSSRPS